MYKRVGLGCWLYPSYIAVRRGSQPIDLCRLVRPLRDYSDFVDQYLISATTEQRGRRQAARRVLELSSSLGGIGSPTDRAPFHLLHGVVYRDMEASTF